MKAQKPGIYHYEDFRKFLKDSYEYLKKTKRSASFRFLAREAGFSSSNYLKLVMDGKRNLSINGAVKVAKALKLNGDENEFFGNLVLFNQAPTTEEKMFYYNRMNKNRKYREIKHLEAKQFEYFSRWYYPAIRELVLLKDFQEDPRWIASRLKPFISIREAEKALSLLQQLELLERDKNKKLCQKNRAITSGDEVQSLAVKTFHLDMLRIAATSIDNTPSSERDISGTMLNLPKSKVAQIKEKIQRFRKDLIATVCTFEDPPEELYELSIQFFPLSRKKI